MSDFTSLAKMINLATKVKSEPEEFSSMYFEARKRADVNRKPSPCYHPSSIGGCSRNLYFQLTRADMDPNLYTDPQLCELGDCGTDSHERIQRNIIAMEKLGYPVQWLHIPTYLENAPELGTRVKRQDGYETLLFNDIYNMSFKCDGLIRFKGKLYILEIKTEVEMKWFGRRAPAPDHIQQATAYSLCLGVEPVLFFYENRNTCAKKSYIHIVSKSAKETLADKIARIDTFVVDEKVPPKEESVDNCKYCDYKTQCIKW